MMPDTAAQERILRRTNGMREDDNNEMTDMESSCQAPSTIPKEPTSCRNAI